MIVEIALTIGMIAILMMAYGLVRQSEFLRAICQNIYRVKRLKGMSDVFEDDELLINTKVPRRLLGSRKKTTAGIVSKKRGVCKSTRTKTKKNK